MLVQHVATTLRFLIAVIPYEHLWMIAASFGMACLLYTSDAADE